MMGERIGVKYFVYGKEHDTKMDQFIVEPMDEELVNMQIYNLKLKIYMMLYDLGELCMLFEAREALKMNDSSED